MQRVLTLVRHAKSSWGDPEVHDFDRPLNERGFKSAPMMAKRLADGNYAVDAIISSPAKRAITTAEIIAKEIKIESVEQNIEIYNAGISALLGLVNSLDDTLNSVMLVGHNPGFTILCNYLSNARIDNMPTCSIAQIQFDVDRWKAITKHSGELINFDYPKKYKQP
jgi:phosphohistidine phosphatase